MTIKQLLAQSRCDTIQNFNSDRGLSILSGNSLEWGARTLVMGIINVTPDSFSGDGEMNSEQAVAKALEHVAHGADIIDIGGESTRPGHEPVDSATEIQRALPVVRELRRQSDTHISIDTFKPEVLREAVKAGANILNSVWGIKDQLLETAVDLNVPIVIMHNKLQPKYDSDVVDEVLSYLHDSANKAVAQGMKVEQVILDPGIGFGKTAEHNIRILKSLDRLVALGFPTLIGTSRKSTLGKLTGRPVEKRAFGTAATITLAIAAGIDIVRVHDVAEMIDVVKVTDAIVRGWRPADWELQA